MNRNLECESCVFRTMLRQDNNRLADEVESLRKELDEMNRIAVHVHDGFAATALGWAQRYMGAAWQRDKLVNTIEEWRRKSWKECSCDYGCDGRMPLRGEKCEKCRLWDAVEDAIKDAKGGAK